MIMLGKKEGGRGGLAGLHAPMFEHAPASNVACSMRILLSTLPPESSHPTNQTTHQSDKWKKKNGRQVTPYRSRVVPCMRQLPTCMRASRLRRSAMHAANRPRRSTPHASDPRQFADGILEITAAAVAQLFDTVGKSARTGMRVCCMIDCMRRDATRTPPQTPPHQNRRPPQEGKLVTKSTRPQLPKGELEGGGVVTLGNFVCELDRPVAFEEFKRGVCFMPEPSASSSLAAPSGYQPPAAKLKGGLGGGKPGSRAGGGGGGAVPVLRSGGAAGGGGAGGGGMPAPLFDPAHPDAVVMNGGQWAGGAGRLRDGRAVVPVVVSRCLGLGWWVEVGALKRNCK